MRVSPGGWVAVLLPTDSWPVTMRVGRAEAQPAFIDHIRGEYGVETWAKVRCPPMRPGRYQVTATTADGTVTDSVHVV